MADLDHEVARGHTAERLINDPVMIEAFDTIRAEYIAAWESAPVRDVEGRERIWAHLQLLGKVRGHLEAVASTGKMAEKQRDELRRTKRLFF